MHAWLSFAYAAYGFIFNFCSCMCRGSRVRVRLCLRERGGCFLFFFLFFVKLTHTFYYIDEQEGMFVAPLPSIPCPFIHPLHMCIVYWYNPKWMSSRKRRLVRDSGDVAASQRPNKIGASFWRFFYCGCCCCWQGRLSSFYVLWLFGRFFFLCFGENQENGWMMMMGLVYECGDLFFFGLYRYFALHGIFDSTIMIFWLSMMTSFVDCWWKF